MKRPHSDLFSERILALVFLFLVPTFLLALFFFRSVEVRQQSYAGLLLARNDVSGAKKIVEGLLSQSPQDDSTILLAAEIAKQELNDSIAMKHFRTLLDSPRPEVRLRAQYRLGESAFQVGKLREAEEYLKAALLTSPHDLKSDQLLGYMLYTEGRTWEALPYLESSVRQGRFLADELAMLASTESWVTIDEHLSMVGSAQGILELGIARVEMLKNQHASAHQRLTILAKNNPSLGEVQGAYANNLLTLEKHEEFIEWKSNLLSPMVMHPEVSFALARFSDQSGDLSDAVKHYRDVLVQHPYHRGATFRLGQLLLQTHSDLGLQLIDRSKELSEIQTLAGELRGTRDEKMAKELCELLLGMGRPLEAGGWASLYLKFFPDEITFREILQAAKPLRIHERKKKSSSSGIA